MEEFLWAPILWASASALCVKMLEMAEIYKLPKLQRPDVTEVWYWIPYLVLPLAGGFLAFIHLQSGQKLSPFLALNIGLTAPLVLRSAIERFSPKVIDPGEGA
ncbi:MULTISPECIES: hypothetical protein [unclassified Pseudomonas]|uniref:hypothetical protein n=1 Tax=unclassified Pseudomonas TaxID=196821 RepID=UPI000C879693|nr:MULTISPECIES: hypothetical protein [unclassified Pseudomonas]PMU11715.1 hypothetical protein C1Y11_04050 [Pseudomonas sp. FW305-20]PMU15397.1 hypothetical protein C1Y10_22520 [Pseudomonas sp. FW305-122]PMU43240.1 hypothetical protein C1Y12_03475 [Pseudomonas sp. FW305-47B]PMX63531.1 hypothetical protein C1X12_22660 [Pseudomonas sp. FW305-60]PMX64565.1 hypothetical protein C1Y13_04270 [Pseudomonas sp. FW305-33]